MRVPWWYRGHSNGQHVWDLLDWEPVEGDRQQLEQLEATTIDEKQ